MKNVIAIMLKNQRTSTADENAARDAELADLKDQMKRIYAERAELREDIAHRHTEITELHKQMRHRHTEITELDYQMAQRHAEIDDLRSQILQIKNVCDERILQIETKLAEVLQTQPSEHQDGPTD